MVPLALHFQALFKKSVSIVPALLLACCVRWLQEFAECLVLISNCEQSFLKAQSSTDYYDGVAVFINDWLWVSNGC